MNSIYRNSLIFSVITALILGAAIRWPQYFLYLLLTLIVAEIIFWAIHFNLQPSVEAVKEKIKFLILPFLFNVGFMFFLFSVFSDFLRYVFLALVVGMNFYLFTALKRVHNLQERAALFYKNILVTSSFFTILFSLSALYRFFVSQSISSSFRVPLSGVVVATGIIFYLVSYFLAFENGVDSAKSQPYLLVLSLLASEFSLFGLIWIVNYPVYSSSERVSLAGLPLPAIILTLIFYFVWGIFSHKIDKSLTRSVIIEYILLTAVFVFVLLVTAKWLPNI